MALVFSEGLAMGLDRNGFWDEEEGPRVQGGRPPWQLAGGELLA